MREVTINFSEDSGVMFYFKVRKFQCYPIASHAFFNYKEHLFIRTKTSFYAFVMNDLSPPNSEVQDFYRYCVPEFKPHSENDSDMEAIFERFNGQEEQINKIIKEQTEMKELFVSEIEKLREDLAAGHNQN